MAFIYKNIVPITTIAATAGAVFTNPSTTTTYVRFISLHNTNTTAEEVVLNLVPNSTGSVGTAAVTNQIFKESIEANGTRILEFPAPGLMLEAENDTLQAVTDTASKVTITSCGGQE